MSRNFTTAVTYALLVLGALAVFVPLFWMISTSLKRESDLFILPQPVWPSQPQWRNYVDVWQIQPLTQFFLNTVFTTVLAMGGEIVTCAIVAYGFARFRFPGRTILTALIDLPFSVSPVVAGLSLVLIDTSASFSRDQRYEEMIEHGHHHRTIGAQYPVIINRSNFGQPFADCPL